MESPSGIIMWSSCSKCNYKPSRAEPTACNSALLTAAQPASTGLLRRVITQTQAKPAFLKMYIISLQQVILRDGAVFPGFKPYVILAREATVGGSSRGLRRCCCSISYQNWSVFIHFLDEYRQRLFQMEILFFCKSFNHQLAPRIGQLAFNRY